MTVEIWSDIVCPWCYIGKRRFETALARFAHRDEVTVVWRSFELDPQAPRRHQGTLDDLLARKTGATPAQAAAMNARVTALAAADGLEYHLDRAQPGNTFDAHRLLHLAADRGLLAVAKERLLCAYFTDGVPIGDPDHLAQIVGEVGLDVDETRAVLAGDTYADDVRADERRAATVGIRGVPFVLVDERYGVSGAQSPDVFLQTLEQAWSAARPLAAGAGTAGAESCEGDSSCEVSA
jgi:predicted DsbA family dithiol-disulfide isomerase